MKSAMIDLSLYHRMDCWSCKYTHPAFSDTHLHHSERYIQLEIIGEYLTQPGCM